MGIKKNGLILSLGIFGVLGSYVAFQDLAASQRAVRIIDDTLTVYQLADEQVYCQKNTGECFNLLNYPYPLQEPEVRSLATNECVANSDGCASVQVPGDPMEY